MPKFSDTHDVYTLIDVETGEVRGWQSVLKGQQPAQAKYYAVYKLAGKH